MESIIGIDASRCRSGGGKCHLINMLLNIDVIIHRYNIQKIHLWTYRALAKEIPDYSWLVKHTPDVLEKNIVKQVWWQYHKLHREVQRVSCNVLFSVDAGTVCSYIPSVVVSQDMLSFEFGEWRRFGVSKATFRIILLKYIQSYSLKHADSAVFLTNYARKTIEKYTRRLDGSKIIPHGIGNEFYTQNKKNDWLVEEKKVINCLYVSNAAMYKHQWHVVKAMGLLRASGLVVNLLLVGGGSGKAQNLLERELHHTDPSGEFTKQLNFVNHERIPDFLSEADIFIFASSCENMPITLLEAMASGLPIACSDRGPMPEILENAGVYFDPENHYSIARAVETLIKNPLLRKSVSEHAQELAKKYTWERCAVETLNLLSSY